MSWTKELSFRWYYTSIGVTTSVLRASISTNGTWLWVPIFTQLSRIICIDINLPEFLEKTYFSLGKTFSFLELIATIFSRLFFPTWELIIYDKCNSSWGLWDQNFPLEKSNWKEGRHSNCFNFYKSEYGFKISVQRSHHHNLLSSFIIRLDQIELGKFNCCSEVLDNYKCILGLNGKLDRTTKVSFPQTQFRVVASKANS